MEIQKFVLTSDFVDKMKAHLANILNKEAIIANLDKENIRDDKARWEYLK